MTTIAFRDGVMAADSQETSSDTAYQCEKLFKRKNLKGEWCIIGTAGGSFSGMKYVECFGDPNAEFPADQISDDADFHCLVWDGEELFEVNKLCQHVLVPQRVPFIAIGSGARVALGAMEMGASAQEAVKAACKYDIYSSGPIKTMKLKEK